MTIMGSCVRRMMVGQRLDESPEPECHIYGSSLARYSNFMQLRLWSVHHMKQNTGRAARKASRCVVSMTALKG